MKRCPTCKRAYADTLTFCLDDGTVLTYERDLDETVVLPLPQRFTLPKTLAQSAPPQSSNRFLYGIILLLAIFAAGITAALVYERDKTPGPGTTGRQEQLSAANSDNKSFSTPETRASATTDPTVQNRKPYAVTGCGSIQDAGTNLEWFVGPDRNTNWYDAQQWTASLPSCGGGWRMPTIEEIRTLYNPSVRAGVGYYTDGKYFPAHINPVFAAIGGGSWVWTDQQVGAGNARSFNLNQGKAVDYADTNTTYSTRAFAVRAIRN